MAIRETAVPPRAWPRLLGGMRTQAQRTRRCPDAPRLDGRLAVVTGASGGIGLEIARGRRARGADPVLRCRSPEKGLAVAERLRAEARTGGSIDIVAIGLADLDPGRER